ncbi:hypothetical protein CSA56_01010 [candidate division KSB3 bacterium]|uniref:Uncharacterized protein n=1 Tax=candidate division KSB3 bacterium TaxID=2044937 RepID=A0A2G6KKP2_9BACT|nr:MAG: hypothetical protein CSA56_01010 [candidate division KSB3 bacterium]
MPGQYVITYFSSKIHKADGTTEVQQVMFEPETVRIDPDVQSVNRALRSFFSIMEYIPETTKKKRRIGTKNKASSPQ